MPTAIQIAGRWLNVREAQCEALVSSGPPGLSPERGSVAITSDGGGR